MRCADSGGVLGGNLCSARDRGVLRGWGQSARAEEQPVLRKGNRSACSRR